MKRLALLMLALAATPALAQPLDHAAHQHAPPPAAAEAQAAPGGPTGTDQPPGSAPPPPIAHDRPADRYWGAAQMAAAEAAEMHPPAPLYAKVIVDIAELQVRDGKDGYRWEAEAWLGNLNRAVLTTRGEGISGSAPERAEIGVHYARALDPWWNLAVGVRQDIRPFPSRTWAMLGIEGRARYQFDVHAAALLSDKGQVTARIEAAHDVRITQRLVLQPRAELNLSAQDMPAERIGAGLSSIELGLRLRYEIRREFAPYIGVGWTSTAGRTAAYARADGERVAERSAVVGVRVWF